MKLVTYGQGRNGPYALNKTYPIVTEDGIKEMSGSELLAEKLLEENKQCEFPFEMLYLDETIFVDFEINRGFI